MAALLIDSIVWQRGSFRLEGATLSVEDGQYAVLMGRTGCGKTSLVEILCGLRRPQSGRIMLHGRDITWDAPGSRKIGYVPQDGALFPTMNVRDQLAFAGRMQGVAKLERHRQAEELAEALGILHLLDRKPTGLSGGERQRVALGRALAAEPSLLVLDEPLSAVDEETRDDLAVLLKSLQRKVGIPALHITHHRAEALALGDVFWRMEHGKCEPLERGVLKEEKIG